MAALHTFKQIYHSNPHNLDVEIHMHFIHEIHSRELKQHLLHILNF